MSAFEAEAKEAIEVAPGALPVEEEVPAGSGLPSAEHSSELFRRPIELCLRRVTAEGDDLCGVPADEDAADDIPWFVQGRKTHLVREEMEGRLTPWCRDFPFVQEHSKPWPRLCWDEQGLPFVSVALAVCPEDCTSPWRNITAGQFDPAHGRENVPRLTLFECRVARLHDLDLHRFAMTGRFMYPLVWVSHELSGMSPICNCL